MGLTVAMVLTVAVFVAAATAANPIDMYIFGISVKFLII